MADENIRQDIVNKYNTLNQSISSLSKTVSDNAQAIQNNSTAITNLSKTVSDNHTALSNKITNIENILGNVSGITIGTSVPTTLSENAIYLQYFT